MGSIAIEYRLPDWPPARIISDAVLAHNLRRPGEEMLSFKDTPWPRLYPVVLAHLRHRHTPYEQELATGGDRETLRCEIHAELKRKYKWLRVGEDPREDATLDYRDCIYLSRCLSNLHSNKAALLRNIADLKRQHPQDGRFHLLALREVLSEVEEEIALKFRIAKKLQELGRWDARKWKPGESIPVVGREHPRPGYRFSGRQEPPECRRQYLDFACPECGARVCRSKSPVDLGAGVRAFVASCLCNSLIFTSKRLILEAGNWGKRRKTKNEN